jgi:hypothetical protein
LTFISQLRRLAPDVRIWAYAADVLPTDSVLAEELDVNELIEYRGDLFRLSDEIVGRVVETFVTRAPEQSPDCEASHAARGPHLPRATARQMQPIR